MVSTTGPDLSFAKEAVERLQDDSCTITRDPAGDDVFNPDTGNVESPPGFNVYNAASLGEGGRSLADAGGTGGRCSVSYKTANQVAYRDEGGRQIMNSTPEARIPIDAPVVREGDFLTVVSSRRDPQLVGQTFRVADVIEATMAVSRRLMLEKR
jgi:hypothetical protein